MNTFLKPTIKKKTATVTLLSLLSLSTFVEANTVPTLTPYSQNYAFNSHDDNSNFTLPDLGSGGSRFIEANQHRALGEWSLQQLANSAPIIRDPWSQDQLESIAWRINAQARNQAPLALVIINSPSINAFAIPGGVMGINTGTIIESNSIDEVASVLAHEVAHLSQRHYEHREAANKKAMLIQIGGMLAAIAASAADGNAATAVMMGSQTAALNSQMAFSRSNEREADRIGMQLMAKAGFDPRAMPKFFATLNEKSQLNMSNQAFLPSFIMSHPLSSERLSEAQRQANSYAVVGLDKQQMQLSFDLLKWRLRVLTNQLTENELLAASTQSKGAALALAYWYGSQGRYQASSAIFQRLKSLPVSDLYSDKVAYDVLAVITEAQVAAMQSKWQQMVQLLQPYHNLYPERRDIKLILSDAWLQLGEYDKVITMLKPVVENRAHDLEALFHIQRAYELLAQKGTSSNSSAQDAWVRSRVAAVHALRYRAQGELWQGKYTDAIVSLQQARKVIEEMSTTKMTTTQPQSKNHTPSINPRPLLALVDSEMAAIKKAGDFNP